MSCNPALRERIEAFDLEGGEAKALTFAVRLAREQGWTADYTARAITEYKRFIYLAASGGSPVCPSEEVDEVWHLHLTCTRSYWHALCRDTLGMELHHDPTRGGPAEVARHRAMYAETLATYEAEFGAPPPADIWPPVDKRFPEARPLPAFAPTNASFGGRMGQVALAAAALVALGAASAGAASLGLIPPFDIEGLAYFKILIPALLAALVVGLLIRHLLAGPRARLVDRSTTLDWAELAYIAGGAPRLATAALARLVTSGAAEIDAAGNMKAAKRPPGHLHLVEEAVLGMLPIRSDGQSGKAAMRRINERVEGAFAASTRRLVERGLALSPQGLRRMARLAAAPFIAVMLVLGVARLFLGLSNGRPVAFLVVVLIVAAVVGWIALGRRGSSPATPRGRAALLGMRMRRPKPRDPIDNKSASPDDAATWVALYGPGLLAGGALGALYDWLPRPAAASSSGCSTSSCSSSCGSGGDGGGGCSGCGGGGD